MYRPTQILFLIKADTCIESRGSCLLPGAVVNEWALTNGLASPSSPLCGGVKTGLIEFVDDVGDCCDKVCASVAGGLCGTAPDPVDAVKTIVVAGVSTGG